MFIESLVLKSINWPLFVVYSRLGNPKAAANIAAELQCWSL